MAQDKKWSMSFKFTQPYHGLDSRQIYEALNNNEAIANELAWIDYVEEEFIQKMLTYPDAEAILNKIKKEMRND
jgi:hypothetical protein